MRNRFGSSALCCVALLGTASCLAAEDWCCFERLQVPNYPLLARQARLSGTVRVEITDRKATVIDTGTPRLLRQAVEAVLENAKVSHGCTSPSRIDFVFVVDADLKPRSCDDGKATLVAPCRVVISASPFPLSGQSENAARQGGR